MDAVATGPQVSALNVRMATLEARRIVPEAELASARAPAPVLHPNLADIYRGRMEQLTATLEADDGEEARELVRGLVESVLPYEATKGFRI